MPWTGLTLGLMLALGGMLPLSAAPASPAAVKPPRSVFTIPHNPKEGCDPFFPNSTRVYEVAGPEKPIAEEVKLVFNGLSGSPGHRLAIINNRSFAVGETGEVQTAHGKVRIHCVAIDVSSVTVTVDGQQHKLHFQAKP